MSCSTMAFFLHRTIIRSRVCPSVACAYQRRRPCREIKLETKLVAVVCRTSPHSILYRWIEGFGTRPTNAFSACWPRGWFCGWKEILIAQRIIVIIIKDDGYAIIGKYQKSRTLRYNFRRRYKMSDQGLEQGLIGDPCRLKKSFDIPFLRKKLRIFSMLRRLRHHHWLPICISILLGIARDRPNCFCRAKAISNRGVWLR